MFCCKGDDTKNNSCCGDDRDSCCGDSKDSCCGEGQCDWEACFKGMSMDELKAKKGKLEEKLEMVNQLLEGKK